MSDQLPMPEPGGLIRESLALVVVIGLLSLVVVGGIAALRQPTVQSMLDPVSGQSNPAAIERKAKYAATLASYGVVNAKAHLYQVPVLEAGARLVREPALLGPLVIVDQGPPEGPAGADPAAVAGQAIYKNNACLGCHSLDGAAGVGPTFKDLWGRAETLDDGTTVTVDETYFKESVLAPGAKTVKGFPKGLMPPQALSDTDLANLMAFVKNPASASGGAAGGASAAGLKVYNDFACMGCHSLDGSPRVGPSFKGVFGKAEALDDGSSVTVDETYLKESILAPAAKTVKGFPKGLMPPQTLSEGDMAAVIEFIKAQK